MPTDLPRFGVTHKESANRPTSSFSALLQRLKVPTDLPRCFRRYYKESADTETYLVVFGVIDYKESANRPTSSVVLGVTTKKGASRPTSSFSVLLQRKVPTDLPQSLFSALLQRKCPQTYVIKGTNRPISSFSALLQRKVPTDLPRRFRRCYKERCQQTYLSRRFRRYKLKPCSRPLGGRTEINTAQRIANTEERPRNNRHSHSNKGTRASV